MVRGRPACWHHEAAGALHTCAALLNQASNFVLFSICIAHKRAWGAQFAENQCGFLAMGSLHLGLTRQP